MGKQPAWALIRRKYAVKLLENQSDADATDTNLVWWRPFGVPSPSFLFCAGTQGVRCEMWYVYFRRLQSVLKRRSCRRNMKLSV